MKQLEVQIMGQGYLLSCPPGGEARLTEAVERVDSAMRKIRDAGKVKARDRIAVLAALNLAADLGVRASPGPGNPTVEAAKADTPKPDAAVPANPDSVTPSPQAHSEQLEALLQRLDAVLGVDGRLL